MPPTLQDLAREASAQFETATRAGRGLTPEDAEQAANALDALHADNLRALAGRIRDAGRQYEDGETFVRMRDGRPEWVFDLCRDAHGEFLPEDWRYVCIRAALDHIAESDADADADDLADESHEFADGHVDVYTGARCAWLASNLERLGYVDDAVSEFGFEFSDERGIVDAIGLGQYAEASEVFSEVLGSLVERLDEIESADEDEELGDACPACGGTGQRSTARTAKGSELERHERAGTPCDACGGSGVRDV